MSSDDRFILLSIGTITKLLRDGGAFALDLGDGREVLLRVHKARDRTAIRVAFIAPPSVKIHRDSDGSISQRFIEEGNASVGRSSSR